MDPRWPSQSHGLPVLRLKHSGRGSDDPVGAADAVLRGRTLRYDLDRRGDGDAGGGEQVEATREREVYDLCASQSKRHGAGDVGVSTTETLSASANSTPEMRRAPTPERPPPNCVLSVSPTAARRLSARPDAVGYSQCAHRQCAAK